ncbi:MAG: response regulator transcription factor [Haliscomenobacter sp.]|nr:response regulator transcription factor [Haliscomenobacter sp.]
MKKMTALIADDQPIVLEGLQSFLGKNPGLAVEVTATAADGTELLELVFGRPFDLVILELNLSGVDGMTALKKIRSRFPGLPIIIFSRYDDPKIVWSTIRDGANAYLLKNSPLEEWRRALEAIREGQTYLGSGIRLEHVKRPEHAEVKKAVFSGEAVEDNAPGIYLLTRRESEILALIAQALSNKEIASRLYISDQTVSVHRKNIMRKLGVCNAAGLVKAAYELGIS